MQSPKKSVNHTKKVSYWDHLGLSCCITDCGTGKDSEEFCQDLSEQNTGCVSALPL